MSFKAEPGGYDAKDTTERVAPICCKVGITSPELFHFSNLCSVIQVVISLIVVMIAHQPIFPT